MIGSASFNTADHQDQVPAREADFVESHTVQHLYLLAGVADIYLETSVEVFEPLWRDMTARKLCEFDRARRSKPFDRRIYWEKS